MSEHAGGPDNASGKELRAVFDSMEFGIAVFNADARLNTVNQAFESLLEFAKIDLTPGLSLREFYRQLALSGAFGYGLVDDIVDAHMRDTGQETAEEILTASDGRLLQIRRYPLPDGDICATLRDVTAERDTQEQLRQASKLDALGRLTGGVAHDFNNVLTVIVGNLELLRDSLTAEPDKRLIDTSMSAAESGARLTHRLLAFARKQPLSPAVCCPGVVLRELVPMLRSLLGEQIQVELVCDAGVWPIEVDRNQLDNVLINIATNARDAMPDGGKLTIEALNARVDDHYAEAAEIDRGQYVCIACSDTGKGMEKSVVEKVFEPFFTTKDVAAGTGLGLAMAHGFVKQSEGHIKIYSEPENGTVVKIYLPRSNAEIDDAPRPLSGGAGDSKQGKTIFVVEDDDQIRQTVQMQLESEGFNVLTAPDAESALRRLEFSAVDLLLTDVVLPGSMNGKVLADKVAEVRPLLPIIFMSGYTENAIIHHGRLDRGVQLLQKPFRKTDLLREIASALAT
ncbi:response regulator [Cognatishimia sp.]|uniref:response regulator n=1 Tax=Cognatishimia sp. TaxID=2211648 RepID=UPI003511ACDE